MGIATNICSSQQKRNVQLDLRQLLAALVRGGAGESPVFVYSLVVLVFWPSMVHHDDLGCLFQPE